MLMVELSLSHGLFGVSESESLSLGPPNYLITCNAGPEGRLESDAQLELNSNSTTYSPFRTPKDAQRGLAQMELTRNGLLS